MERAIYVLGISLILTGTLIWLISVWSVCNLHSILMLGGGVLTGINLLIPSDED